MPSVIQKKIHGRQMAPEERDDFMRIAEANIKVLTKFHELFDDPKRKKTTMLKARCLRPGCGGMIYARISGPRRHIHFACSNAGKGCYYQGME